MEVALRSEWPLVIHHQPERDHPRLRFSVRTVLMIEAVTGTV
jgi:hypothetical protein